MLNLEQEKLHLINSEIIPELEENRLFVLPVARVRFQEADRVSSHFFKSSNNKADNSVYLTSSQLDESLYNPFMHSALQYLATNFDTQDKDSDFLNFNMTLHDFLTKKFKENEDALESKKGVAIIFDQLEELFRTSRKISRETLRDFFNQIARALEIENLSLRIILVIREDYLAQLDPFAFILPERLRPRFRLERLRIDEALEALEKPLIKSKEFFKESKRNERIDRLLKKHRNLSDESESGATRVHSEFLSVTEKIVNNLRTMQVELPEGGTQEIPGDFIEPIYLQIVGQRLWDKLDSPISGESLDYLGDGGDVSKTLAEFYEKAIVETAKESVLSEGDIRIWCEKNLITTSGTRGSVHRGIEFTAGLPNRVLDILEDKHVIRAEIRGDGGKWYELTHD